MPIETGDEAEAERLTDEEKIARMIGRMPPEQFARWTERLFGRAAQKKRADARDKGRGKSTDPRDRAGDERR